jgi:hypothetical protein
MILNDLFLGFCPWLGDAHNPVCPVSERVPSAVAETSTSKRIDRQIHENKTSTGKSRIKNSVWLFCTNHVLRS